MSAINACMAQATLHLQTFQSALPKWHLNRYLSNLHTVMSQEINSKSLAEAIIRHREAKKLTVRAAAIEIENVSPSTLSRIERGNLPDLDSYMRICRWLEVDPAHFAVAPTGKKTSEEESPLQREDIITHLRADQLLSKQTREALITMIEVAYAAARRNIFPNESQIPT